jgi:hypothetical protein
MPEGEWALGGGASPEYNASMAGMDPLPASERLRLAFDLYELGEELLRQRFRREHPEMSAGDIETRVEEWRLRRPGAELGDGEGVPVPWPRRP